MGISDNHWMFLAYEQALRAESAGEVPVGAIVVSSNDHILGRGYNQVIQSNDPTAHAEILALRQAATGIHNYRLENCTLFVTLEPCAMCAGALIHARIKRLVYATRDFKSGAAGSLLNIPGSSVLNHQLVIDEGIMQSECSELLRSFFQKRRFAQ